jgi:Zn-dependent M28 family amino/carboxypeptidase
VRHFDLRRIRPVLLAAVVAAGAGAWGSQTAAPARADADRLMSDVRTLSGPAFEGRRTGTEGNRRARDFIVQRFRDLKLDPLNGTYEHAFTLARPTRESGASPSGSDAVEAVNLAAVIRGSAEPDRFTLVSAHFDHLGVRNGRVHPGADDNASGVAGLLAVASFFAAHHPRRSILLVAFDAEEQGLQGAARFVTHPPVDLTRIASVVNLDMIGRGDANTLYVAGTHHYPQLKPAVLEAARGRRIVVAFGHDRPKTEAPKVQDWTHSSDHGPFHDAGIPFLYFGVEDHADYHKPTDTADRIPRVFFTEAVNLVIDVVARLTGTDL